jgi:hypothetical protein
MTVEHRAKLRKHLSRRRGPSVLVWHDHLRALLDAADERDRLVAVAPCSETRTEPFDFAYCSTHDRTFALGEHCDYAGLSEVEYLEKQARVQRFRAIRAEDERDRLAAAVERVRVLAEDWRYKGEFGWGAWQEGYGPDQAGLALDDAATKTLRALDGTDEKEDS